LLHKNIPKLQKNYKFALRSFVNFDPNDLSFLPITMTELVSISSTFYARLLRTKVLWAAFFLVTFWLWWKYKSNFRQKHTCKMLIKLIPGRDGCVDQQFVLFSNIFYRTRLNLLKYYNLFCYITVISKCNWNIYSRQPSLVYNDHPCDHKMVAVVVNWSLFRGHLYGKSSIWDHEMMAILDKWSLSQVWLYHFLLSSQAFFNGKVIFLIILEYLEFYCNNTVVKFKLR